MARHSQDKRLARTIEEHLDALYRLAVRLTGDEPAAEDLVQETCLRAWRGRRSLHSDANLKAWLFRILRNAWTDAARKAGREPTLVALAPESALPEAEYPPVPPRDVTDREQLESYLDQELISALDELTEEERLVVLYQTIAEMTYREISEAMSCPLGSVMSRLHRARAKLRIRLAARARDCGIGNQTSDSPDRQPSKQRHGTV